MSIKIPKIAFIKYSINDVKISENVRRERIADLRKRTDVLVIDDENFEPKDFLEKNNYRLTIKHDIDNTKDVSEYPIILCDIRGVGTKISPAFEGAFLIKEIKKNYPEKIVIAYTASQYDPSYNGYIRKADNVLPKDLSMEDWLEQLDKYIYMLADPVEQWKILRQKLFNVDAPLIDVAKLESSFVDAYLRNEFDNFKKLVEKETSEDVKNLAGDFIANVVNRLVRGD